MKAILFLTLIMLGCSTPSDPIEPTPGPWDEFYWLAATPDWEATAIQGSWVYGNFRIDDSVFTADYGTAKYVGTMDVRTNAGELWFKTTGGEYRFRGARTADQIIGKMIRIDRGRPGPIENVTYKRAK